MSKGMPSTLKVRVPPSSSHTSQTSSNSQEKHLKVAPQKFICEKMKIETNTAEYTFHVKPFDARYYPDGIGKWLWHTWSNNEYCGIRFIGYVFMVRFKN